MVLSSIFAVWVYFILITDHFQYQAGRKYSLCIQQGRYFQVKHGRRFDLWSVFNDSFSLWFLWVLSPAEVNELLCVAGGRGEDLGGGKRDERKERDGWGGSTRSTRSIAVIRGAAARITGSPTSAFPGRARAPSM